MQAWAPGAILDGKYRVEQLLGRGASGAVFLAVHERLGTRLAIKRLNDGADAVMRARFEREGIAACRICSPHVVRVHDVGETSDGCPYLVMELLEGADLLQLERSEGPQPTARVIDRLLQLCAGVAAIHAEGIVHRDLKLSNVMVVASNGREAVKVLDFGISKLPAVAELTLEESTLGTPLYMAPEQLRRGECVSFAADQFSIGVMAYRMLGAANPYVLPGVNELPVMAALANLTAELTPLRTHRPDLPPGLCEAIERALARAPTERWPNVRQLALALEPYGSGLVRYDGPDETSLAQRSADSARHLEPATSGRSRRAAPGARTEEPTLQAPDSRRATTPSATAAEATESEPDTQREPLPLHLPEDAASSAEGLGRGRVLAPWVWGALCLSLAAGGFWALRRPPVAASAPRQELPASRAVATAAPPRGDTSEEPLLPAAERVAVRGAEDLSLEPFEPLPVSAASRALPASHRAPRPTARPSHRAPRASDASLHPVAAPRPAASVRVPPNYL